MLYENMYETIGNTPLVKLHLTNSNGGNVYAKLEMMNPFGMKDRVAKQMILSAKKSGQLKDSMPIFESSSGTMACGLALVGTQLGHKIHIVTDPRIDEITLAKLESLGCEVHIVSKIGKQGWQSARLELLQDLLKQHPDSYWTRQYENEENPNAYKELADELMDDLSRVDVLIGSVGSGGSLCGTARRLKSFNPNMKVVAVDSTGSVIFGQPDRPNRLQGGLGNSLIAANVDFSVIDEVHWLNDSEAFYGTLQLAKEQQIFAGNSSGSVYVVSRWMSSKVPQDYNIVAIFPDRGDRYMSTIYSQEYRQQSELALVDFEEVPREVELDTIVTSWSYTKLMGMNPHEQKNPIYRVEYNRNGNVSDS